MLPAGNKTKSFSSVSHTTKAIHHHRHHHQFDLLAVNILNNATTESFTDRAVKPKKPQLVNITVSLEVPQK